MAALLAAPAISLNAESPILARPGTAEGLAISPRAISAETGASRAAISLVRALSAKDLEGVWMFASEEEQDAFGTEEALYEAYAETFPALAAAKEIDIERTWQEGDTPFVEARVIKADGDAFRATMGFWLSDAGDWQLVSCDVKPADDRIAGL